MIAGDVAACDVVSCGVVASDGCQHVVVSSVVLAARFNWLPVILQEVIWFSLQNQRQSSWGPSQEQHLQVRLASTIQCFPVSDICCWQQQACFRKKFC